MAGTAVSWPRPGGRVASAAVAEGETKDATTISDAVIVVATGGEAAPELERHASKPVSHFDHWAKEDEAEAAAAPPLLPSTASDATTESHKAATSSLTPLPPLARPFSRPNLALTVGNFVYGLVSAFVRVPIGYYIIQNLRMSAAASNVSGTMLILPQAFQLPLGLLTDTVPINQQRRRPYLVIGWALVAAAMAGLAVVGRPDFPTLMAFVFLMALGGQLVVVTTNAAVVQRSELEGEAQKGQLVVTASLCASAGSTLGVLLGTFLYKDQFHQEAGDGAASGGDGAAVARAKSLSLGQIGLVNALLVLVVMAPCLYWMHDPKLTFLPPSPAPVASSEEDGGGDELQQHQQQEDEETSTEATTTATAGQGSHWRARPLREELGDVWATVQRTSLLWPMLFVGVYQTVWCPNSAWDLFLIKGLGFSEWRLGMLALTGLVLGTLGTALYRFCLMGVNWRHIFVATMVIMVLMDCLQLVLVFRANATWGIPDFPFALGDTAVDSMVEGLHQMPLNIMYLSFCPRGAEGTTLALLTTFTSLASMMSNNVALLLLRVWDVSADTIARGGFGGVWRLTLLTSAIQALGVAGVFLIPTSARDQKERQRRDTSSFWGGLAFVAFVVVAFVWTVAADVYFLVTGKGGSD